MKNKLKQLMQLLTFIIGLILLSLILIVPLYIAIIYSPLWLLLYLVIGVPIYIIAILITLIIDL